jgi:hypothetical protein
MTPQKKISMICDFVNKNDRSPKVLEIALPLIIADLFEKIAQLRFD